MGEIVRRKKTGGLYEVLFRGAVIHSDAPLSDDAPITVCRRLPDGQIVARFGPTPRGSFDVLHHSRLQTDVLLHDGAEVVVYRAVGGGPVWVRRASEMDDGRFEPADAPQPPSSTPGEAERLVDALVSAVMQHAWYALSDLLLEDKEAETRAARDEARTALLSHISTAGRASSTDGVIKDRGEGRTLSPEVEARVRAGRSRDGWEAWAQTDSHVLRIALRLDGEAVALLEAFSISGPWYANAISPEGERHRLGAGISLAGAVQWCEVTTGYVMTPASTVQAPSSQESGVGETEGWQPIETAPDPTPTLKREEQP